MGITQEHNKQISDLVSRIGEVNFLWITLDSLRFDAAQEAFEEGLLKTFGEHLPESGWQKCHSPASFTYAAHHAFFSGFLPTPATPGPHPRRYASKFSGSETTTEETYVFSEPTFPEALSERGYQTFCVGGTGFFNSETNLGSTLPSLFQKSHWSPETSVTDPKSHENQVKVALDFLRQEWNRPSFLFMNIAAIHQPNWFYRTHNDFEELNQKDDFGSHKNALIAVDGAIKELFDFYQRQDRRTVCMLCSDHGTAYGEDGYEGHRLAHSVVMEVPFAEFIL